MAVIAYHSFQSLTYLMSLFGGYLADSWVGKYNAILFLAMVSLTGTIILTFSTINPPDFDPTENTSQR